MLNINFLGKMSCRRAAGRIGEIKGAGDWIEALQKAGAWGRRALMLSKRIEAFDSVLQGQRHQSGWSGFNRTTFFSKRFNC